MIYRRIQIHGVPTIITTCKAAQKRIYHRLAAEATKPAAAREPVQPQKENDRNGLDALDLHDPIWWHDNYILPKHRTLTGSRGLKGGHRLSGSVNPGMSDLIDIFGTTGGNGGGVVGIILEDPIMRATYNTI